jgi:hypothetical protein
MDDLFKRTIRDVQLYTKHFNTIRDRAVELGLAQEDINVPRSVSKVDAAVREYLVLEALAKELGYKSVRVALKALSQMKQQPTYDLTKLPETFHKVPAIWLDGKTPNRVHPGFAPLSRTQAERAHRVIMPLLIEAWELSKDEENVRDQVTNAYLTSSADEFEKDLYKYIYDLEEVPLEVQLAEAAAIKKAEGIDYENANALGGKKPKNKY